jgi:hypothetical protein
MNKSPIKVDTPIIGIIRAFNKIGLTTIASCAGYPYPGHPAKHGGDRPYIKFAPLTPERAALVKKIITGSKFLMPYSWRANSQFVPHCGGLNVIEMRKDFSTRDKIAQWGVLRYNLQMFTVVLW